MLIMTATGWARIHTRNVIPAGYTPSLCEQMGVNTNTSIEQDCEHYCEAIRSFLAGQTSEKRMREITGTTKLV